MRRKKKNSHFTFAISALCVLAAVLLFLIFRVSAKNHDLINKIEAQGNQDSSDFPLTSAAKAESSAPAATQAEEPRAESESGRESEKSTTTAATELHESELDRIKRLIAPVEPGDANADYMIRVFKDIQIVAVFTDSGNGQFDNLLHAFPCCTAIPPNETPSGPTRIGTKFLSGYMMDGSYGQYCSEFLQYHYFHGVPSYHGEPEAGVSWEDFNNLGNPASHGCIRLQAKDAKWIFSYCKEGTAVEVLDDSSAFPQVPADIETVKMKADGPQWDPTNDNPQNPYQIDPSLLLP